MVDKPEQQLKIGLLKFRREAGTSRETVTGTVKIRGTHSEPQCWCEDCFKLETLEIQQMQEKTPSWSFPYLTKASISEIRLP